MSLIQSVDSERLLAAIDREAARQGIVQDILLEVNIGEEASKVRFLPRGHSSFDGKKLAEFSNICIKGLMAIPNQPHFGEKIKNFFKKCSTYLLT